jgi:hypothetical protein
MQLRGQERNLRRAVAKLLFHGGPVLVRHRDIIGDILFYVRFTCWLQFR